MAGKVKEPVPLALEVSMDKESSPLPVSSIDKKQQPPPPLLAVVVDVKPSPSPAVPVGKKEKPPAVLLVCLWALLNAGIFAGGSIATLIMNRTPCTKSTWWTRCVELTAAAAAEASALEQRQLWCSAPQAAAAALALLLTVRRRRRNRSGSRWGWALAFVALAATAANHYMEDRVDRIFLAAALGDAYIVADVVLGFVVALLDMVGFICLLLLRDGGEE